MPLIQRVWTRASTHLASFLLDVTETVAFYSSGAENCLDALKFDKFQNGGLNSLI